MRITKDSLLLTVTIVDCIVYMYKVGFICFEDCSKLAEYPKYDGLSENEGLIKDFKTTNQEYMYIPSTIFHCF